MSPKALILLGGLGVIGGKALPESYPWARLLLLVGGGAATVYGSWQHATS